MGIWLYVNSIWYDCLVYDSDMQSVHSHAAFLASLYGLLFELPDGTLHSMAMYSFLPREIFIPSGGFPTVDQLMTDLASLNKVDEAFNLAISKLHTDWPRLKSETRRLIRDLIVEQQLTRLFEKDILHVSPEEQLDLSICWDIATIVFENRKRVILESLKRKNIDLERRTAPKFYNYPTAEKVAFKLLPLLRISRDCDISTLQLSVPNHLSRYRERVSGRCKNVYFDILETLRSTVQKASAEYFSEAHSERRTALEFEMYLETFKQKAKEIIENTSMSVLDLAVLKDVRTLVQTPIHNFHWETTNVKNQFNNKGSGQQTVVTDHAKVTSISQYGAAPTNFDLAELSQQLAELRAKAQQTAQTGDEFRDVATIADAEELAMKGDREGTLEKLMSLGKWAGNLATEIGASIAAKIIGGYVGLG